MIPSKNIEIRTNDCLNGREIEPPGENREPLKQGLVGICKKFEAPGDGAFQRPQAIGLVMRTTDKHGQSMLQPFEKGRRRHMVYARSSQFNRERQSFEPNTDPSDRRSILDGQRKSCARSERTLEEKV